MCRPSRSGHYAKDGQLSELNLRQAYWHSQPLDHFNKHDKRTWNQRYWINTRHYKPNTSAPVIVLDGGETSGANRLPFLDTGLSCQSTIFVHSLISLQGIVEILAKATGGVGVVLEHRYYGALLPSHSPFALTANIYRPLSPCCQSFHGLVALA